MSYSNIPEELRQLKQWCVWLAVPQENGKVTKIPYNPNNGYPASVTDPSTWGTFEQAIAAAPNVTGIGFVLTDNDPYSVIDLDYTEDAEELNRQIAITNAFVSYAEISPSQKGLHVWVKGKVPSGRRKANIEIYSSGRYMTVTGQHYRNTYINDCNDKLNLLWAEMKSGNDVPEAIVSQEQRVDDDEIIRIASSALNADKFNMLFSGDWNSHYPSQSEADFALIDIIAYYTQNIDQILRLFRKSQLGKRVKAKRDTYITNMVRRSFDRQPPPADLATLQQNLEQELVKLQTKKEEPVAKIVKKTKFDLPAGLVGDMISFFYEAAPLPVPEIAVVTALGLMAGVCGRSYNISATGLNQYFLLLANTGSGKESITKNMDKLMTEVYKTVPAATQFIGPGEIASPQALIKYMDKTSQSFVTLVGEVSIMFKQLCSVKANRHEAGIKRLFLQLFSASGKGSSFKPMIYSDAANNTKSIDNPAFSMIGEGTPEEFYELLSDDLIRSGFLPRFTIIEYEGKSPHLNEHHHKVKPSAQLVDRFSTLCAYSLQLNNGNNVIDVQCDKQAEKLLKGFYLKCHNARNDAANETQRHLWNRGHLKALRIAALLAVGVNYIQPVIDEHQALWATSLVENDIVNLLTRFELGTVGMPSIHNEQHKDIKRSFVKYVTGEWKEVEKLNGATMPTWSNKVVPYSFITSYCRSKPSFRNDKLGPVNAIKNAINNMVECGLIAEVGVADKKEKGFGVNGKVYGIINLGELRK